MLQPFITDEQHRRLKFHLKEMKREKAQALKLWDELRQKAEKLPALMDKAKARAEASGTLAEGYIDGSEVGELLYEIEEIRKQIRIDFLL